MFMCAKTLCSYQDHFGFDSMNILFLMQINMGGGTFKIIRSPKSHHLQCIMYEDGFNYLNMLYCFLFIFTVIFFSFFLTCLFVGLQFNLVLYILVELHLFSDLGFCFSCFCFVLFCSFLSVLSCLFLFGYFFPNRHIQILCFFF